MAGGIFPSFNFESCRRRKSYDDHFVGVDVDLPNHIQLCAGQVFRVRRAGGMDRHGHRLVRKSAVYGFEI